MKRITLIIIFTFSSIPAKDFENIKEYKIKIIRTIKHSGERRFTQGLLYYNGFLYESTGKTGQTSLKKIDISSGKVVLQADLENYFPRGKMYFGEGIVIWNGEIIQLSWLAKKAFVYSLDFKKLGKEYRYETEGWGLTCNNELLIMSDGSSNIYFRDPNNFRVVKKIKTQISNINELEYAGGVIYANIWLKPIIVMIDESSGVILGIINAQALCRMEPRYDDYNNVLNGIAYNPRKRTFYLTGKNWDKIYEVEFY